MQPDVGRYLSSWAKELISRMDRVRLLIGDAHWLSDGHHKEYLLKEFLQRHLPSGLSIARGFIKPPDDDLHCSPEIDILISDPSRHPPYFNEGGLVVVPPSSVLACLETKTLLSKKKLVEAIQAQCAAYRTISTYASNADARWRGILFASADASASLDSTMKMIAGAVISACSANTDITAPSLPNCIGTYDRFFYLLAPTGEDSCKLRGFDLGELSVGCFFNELSAALDALMLKQGFHRELQDIVSRISAPSQIMDVSLSGQAE